MKNLYICLVSFTMLISSCTITNYPQSNVPASSEDITYQQFYDDLSPYGQWVDYQNYGYVWMPDVSGFRPYYNNGQWVYTDYGWTWVSSYNWGWAPFHYGRWLQDDMYGWLWVPGYEWAPAWVAWRSGGDYYGWAPLGPGMNINSNFGGNLPYNYWSFVPQRYINSPRINDYYIDRGRNVNIINNTTIINNTRVFNNRNIYTGPSQNDVERNTHEKIQPVRIVQRNTPGDTRYEGSTVSIYKPPVKEAPNRGGQFRPRKIENINDVRDRRSGVNNNTDRNNNQRNDQPVNQRNFPDNNQGNDRNNQRNNNGNFGNNPQPNQSDNRNNNQQNNTNQRTDQNQQQNKNDNLKDNGNNPQRNNENNRGNGNNNQRNDQNQQNNLNPTDNLRPMPEPQKNNNVPQTQSRRIFNTQKPPATNSVNNRQNNDQPAEQRPPANMIIQKTNTGRERMNSRNEQPNNNPAPAQPQPPVKNNQPNQNPPNNRPENDRRQQNPPSNQRTMQPAPQQSRPAMIMRDQNAAKQEQIKRENNNKVDKKE